MHLKVTVPLLLAGGAVADYAAYRASQGYEVPALQRAPQDGADIGKFMGDLAKSFDKMDSIIATITKDNVAGKMKELVDGKEPLHCCVFPTDYGYRG
jgi:hypothetical protein